MNDRGRILPPQELPQGAGVPREASLDSEILLTTDSRQVFEGWIYAAFCRGCQQQEFERWRLLFDKFREEKTNEREANRQRTKESRVSVPRVDGLRAISNRATALKNALSKKGGWGNPLTKEEIARATGLSEKEINQLIRHAV